MLRDFVCGHNQKKMKVLKKISCIAILAISSLLPFQGQAQRTLEDPTSGCSIKVMGMDIPCTRVWCPSTMSMSACNTGGATTSQTCNTVIYC